MMRAILRCILFLPFLPIAIQGADVKVNELPVNTSPSRSSAFVPFSQGTTTYRASVSTLTSDKASTNHTHSGMVTNSGTATASELVKYNNSSGVSIGPSGIFASSSSTAGLAIPSSGDTNKFLSIEAHPSMTTNVNLVAFRFPPPDGSLVGVAVSGTNVYLTNQVGGASSDADAIHDNVSGEIAAITDKATPVVGDHLLIEDSAASNAKKDITIGSLETPLESVLDLDQLQGAVTTGQLPSGALLESEIDTSAKLAGLLGDETGTGSSVFANSPTFTDDIGVGVAPAAGTAIKVKGTTTDETAHVFSATDSANRRIVTFYNDSRLNLENYSSGGIIALYNLDSPLNGNIAGHYAFGANDSDGTSHTHTIARLNAYITDVTPTSLDSKITFGYMEDHDGKPGGTYAYQQPNKSVEISKDGMIIPPVLRLGTNYATQGQIGLPNSTYIRGRNAANSGDVDMLRITSADAIQVGGVNASLVTFQTGGTDRFYVGSTALNVGADNTYDIGATANRPRVVYARSIDNSGNSTVGGDVIIGSTPASAGAVRLPNNTFIRGRNAADSGDVDMLKITSANAVEVGGVNSTLVSFKTSGTDRWYIGSTALNVATDATYDLGTSSARVRSAYLGGANNTPALTVNGGSVTGSGATSFETHTGTWNTSGNPTAFLYNVTNTASGSSAMIADFQTGSTSRLSIRKDGYTKTPFGVSMPWWLDASDNIVGKTINYTGISFSAEFTGAVGLGGGNVVMSAESANVLQLWIDAASPVAQRIKAHDGSGSNIAGADLSVGPGNGTGTGKSGAFNVLLAPFGTTGSSQNTPVKRFIVAPEITLTDAATSAFEIALPTLRTAGGVIRWTVEAGDGTDVQSYSGVTVYSAVNKGGSYTTTITTPGTQTEAKALSSGTLTGSWSILNGSNKVTLQFTPNGSLTETTYRLFFTIDNNSRQEITLL